MTRILTILFVLFAFQAYAAYTGPTSDTYNGANTAAAAMQAPEGATCVLEGNITMRIRGNRYMFKDASGTIEIDIPPHVFGDMDVSDKDRVKITGEKAVPPSAFAPGPKGKGPRPDDADHIRVRYIQKIK